MNHFLSFKFSVSPFNYHIFTFIKVPPVCTPIFHSKASINSFRRILLVNDSIIRYYVLIQAAYFYTQSIKKILIHVRGGA